jgi:hypothetical protein
MPEMFEAGYWMLVFGYWMFDRTRITFFFSNQHQASRSFVGLRHSFNNSWVSAWKTIFLGKSDV